MATAVIKETGIFGMLPSNEQELASYTSGMSDLLRKIHDDSQIVADHLQKELAKLPSVGTMSSASKARRVTGPLSKIADSTQNARRNAILSNRRFNSAYREDIARAGKGTQSKFTITGG